MFKTVYLWDEVTFEYKGEYAAQASPLEPDVYITPVFSTEIAPPAFSVGFAQCLIDDAWLARSDHRGEVWYRPDGEAVEISVLGDVPAADWTREKPAPDLVTLKALKSDEIEVWRDEAFYGNVWVAINGVMYQWQADKRSQDLLTDAFNLASQGVRPCPPIWRTFDNIDVSITLADLGLIIGAAWDSGQAAYYHSFALKAEVQAASTAQALDAVVWE